jgi:hypothetical protein
MLEELGWILVFLLCFIWTHYQFKYCIPVTLQIMKFIHACTMLLFIRLYILFRIENYAVDWSKIQNDIYDSLKPFAQQYKTDL